MGIRTNYGNSVNVDTAQFESRVTTAESNILNHNVQLADIVHLVPAPTGVDDTLNIQTALNLKGHVKITKPGIYLTGRLVIDSDTTLELANGVTLKKKDGTNEHLLVSKGYIDESRSKNITIKGGIWDFNKAGNTGGGSYLDTPRTWSEIGIALYKIDGLEICDIKEIGNEWKYCFVIADCTNIKCKNINLNNDSDGLHFQPPISNLLVENITGYTGDDMIAFTMGDYPRYALGVDGDIENVIVRNVHANEGTAEHIKLVGSGINGTSVFRNMRFENISGHAVISSVYIMKEDQASPNAYLLNTKLENVYFTNINPILSNSAAYFDIGAVSGDVTIENITVKQQSTLRPMTFRGNIDKVTLNNIKCTDNATPINTNFFIRVDGSNTQIKQMNINNCELYLNPTSSPGFLYVTNNSLVNLLISNSVFDLVNAKGDLVQYDGSSGTTANIKLDNVRVLSCRMGVGTFTTPAKIHATNFETNPSAQTIYFSDGANIRLVTAGCRISPKLYVNGLSALRIFSLSGIDVGYDGLLSALTPETGDIVRCINASEPAGKGLHYFDTTWTKLN